MNLNFTWHGYIEFIYFVVYFLILTFHQNCVENSEPIAGDIYAYSNIIKIPLEKEKEREGVAIKILCWSGE